MAVFKDADPVIETEIDASSFHLISDQGSFGICYAHATAHAIQETENRIIGRKVMTHAEYVEEIVEKYGTKGANCAGVLNWQCKKRSLGYSNVDVNGAKEALDKGRVIVATFHFNEGQWKKFSKFYAREKNRNRVYEKCDIGKGKHGKENGGHAVAIIGYGGPAISNVTGKKVYYWKIKNSWGDLWADGGYFRFSFDMPLTYYDVFFRQVDLTDQDWKNYRQHNREEDPEPEPRCPCICVLL